MATKLEFLVAKLKVVLALATVSVAISSPVRNVNRFLEGIINFVFGSNIVNTGEWL